MVRCCLVLLLLLAGATVEAQEFRKPDFIQIEKGIRDQASGLYYPKLMARYLQGDSTMTEQEREYLYYGFTFQDGYAPYTMTPFDDSLREVVRKDALEPADYYRMIRYADSILAKNPFSMRTLNYQAFAYRKLEKRQEWEGNIRKIRTILNAIINTGDGKSEATAFVVIAVQDEYSLIHALSFEFGGNQQLVNGHFDYLALKENKFNIEGLYFDVSTSMDYLNRTFIQKKSGSVADR